MTPALVERTPETVHRLPVAAHARHHEAKYRHPFRKARLFALRDGVLETVRKARSKLVERRVEAAQQVLVCGWDEGGARRIGITRDLGGTPRFHPALLFSAPDHLAVDGLRFDDETLALLEAYLPVPECPLADRVAGAIRAANPALGNGRPGEAPAGQAVARTGPQVAPTGPGPRAVRSNAGSWSRRERATFFLGYGGYVREQVLPCFRATAAGAVDHKAELLKAHHRGDFPLYRDLEELLPAIAAAERPLVIVATYHSDHARSALAVLDANPGARVFVEKPVAVTVPEAESLAARRAAGAWIDVGFNRRYAAMTRALIEAAGSLPGPLVFNALVKELKIPPSHWYLWPNQGTRVTGNLCHWIDLAHALARGDCVSVRAAASDGTVSAILEFEDGSLATLVASDAGDDLGGVMEHLELRGGETTLIVDDYRRLVTASEGRHRVRRTRREKGHRRMYRDLRRRWLDGGAPAYPADHIVAVARTTAWVVEAAASASSASNAGP